jgi:elongation factor 3
MGTIDVEGLAPPVKAADVSAHEVDAVSALLQRLLAGSKDDPADLGNAASTAGLAALDSGLMSKTLAEALDNTADPVAREGALLAIKGLASSMGRPAEPYLVPLLPKVFERHADKVQPVREAAQAAAAALAKALCLHAVPLIMPQLYEAMGHKSWQVKEGALMLLHQLVLSAPAQIAMALPEIVPTAGECLIDPREQVKKAAWTAMSAAFKLSGNRDIESCVPAMLSCIARPAEVGDTISKLSACVYVQVSRQT